MPIFTCWVFCLVVKGKMEVAEVRAVRARPNKLSSEPPVAARGKGRPKKRSAAMVPLQERPDTAATHLPQSKDVQVATLLFSGALPSMQTSKTVYSLETQASLASRLDMNKQKISQKLNALAYRGWLAARNLTAGVWLAALRKCGTYVTTSEDGSEVRDAIQPAVFVRKRKYDGTRMWSKCGNAPASGEAGDTEVGDVVGHHELFVIEVGWALALRRYSTSFHGVQFLHMRGTTPTHLTTVDGTTAEVNVEGLRQLEYDADDKIDQAFPRVIDVPMTGGHPAID